MKGWLAFVAAEAVGLALCLVVVWALGLDSVVAVLLGLLMGSVWFYVAAGVRERVR